MYLGDSALGQQIVSFFLGELEHRAGRNDHQLVVAAGVDFVNGLVGCVP